MSGGSASDETRELLKKTLETFVNVLRPACSALGLNSGQVPFIRPINFVAVINPGVIHLVVDDVPIGGIPNHVYLDRRTEIPELPLDGVVGVAVNQLAFRQPVGVTLPLAALTEDENARLRVLRPAATQVAQQLHNRAVVHRLQLPPGYEHFSRFMPEFLADHPQVERNVFLMMRFRDTPQYREIHESIVEAMSRFGLNVIRADDRDYTGDLWENVCLYMLGSRFGVSVFDEIETREFSPNVSLELGFMIGHSKRCLLLKEQRMPSLPTDIVGKLYREFDSYDISGSIAAAVEAWARDLSLRPI